MKRKFRRLITVSAILAFAGILFSADFASRRLYSPQIPVEHVSVPPVKARPEVIFLPRPAEAVQLALSDLQSIGVHDRCYIRYLWLPSGTKTAMKVASLTLNYVSRGSVIVLPMPIAGGHMLRLDLRWYAPQEADLKEWLTIWESFAFDPTFALLITKDSIQFGERLAKLASSRVNSHLPELRKKRVTITHKGGPYSAPDDSGRSWPDLAPGRYYFDLEYKAQAAKARPNQVDVFRENAPYLPETYRQLQEQTHSLAPIVESEYFLTRALSTIRTEAGKAADGKSVFENVWGGLYYQLRGIRKSKVKGATDLDVFFQDLGIGNIKAGLKQEQLFNQLRSDQRLAVFRSDITGKPREVSSFHTPADREGGSWGAITGDIKDADVDVGDRAFANLLNPRRQAREAIFPTRIGLSVFALFNAAGELQDEVPPDVAVDSTIPSPYTRRLQPAIGCLRCHGPHDGWQPLVNDVKRLTAGKLDIFGDLSVKRAVDPDTIDRLAGLYAGDFSRNLRRARDDVAHVTLQATGPWKESETQADVAKIASAAIADQWHDYNYTLIDAQKALRHLGMDVTKAKANEVFKRLMALPPGDPNGLYLERPTIAAIGQGIPVLPVDFWIIFAEMMDRAQTNLQKEPVK